MGFGRTLAAYRKRSGISQVKFAERLGVNRQHLNEIEREKVNPPKLETILFMIGSLHLNIDEAVDLLLEAGRLPRPQNILTTMSIEKLAQSLEALEAAVQDTEPLYKKLRDILRTTQQELLGSYDP